MQDILLLLLLSKDCVLYYTAIALLLLCMQCVCTHSFSSFSMAAHMILGITMLAIGVMTHETMILGITTLVIWVSTTHLVLWRITRCSCLHPTCPIATAAVV